LRPRRVVEQGYDSIGRDYAAWVATIEGEPTEHFVSRFAEYLPAGARVLDLGCGPGVPITRTLAQRFDVLAVDVSAAQLDVARSNVPDATFLHADICELSFPAATWDGIAALASITHIPREEHGRLLRRFAEWLAPGGALLASLGAEAVPGSTAEWLGVPMFYSSYDADRNRRLVTQAGLEAIVDEVVSTATPDGRRGRELWLIARLRRSSSGGMGVTQPSERGDG
jgi:SAM-dependent methyltransferase